MTEYKRIIREIYDKSASEYWLQSRFLYGQSPLSQLYDMRENEIIFRELLAHIDVKDVKVLDVGCGPGRWVIRYTGEGSDLTGIDISLNMLRCARMNAKKEDMNTNLVLCDAENLPFRSNAFYLVNCIDALVSRPQGPEKSISEIARVLKAGGIAIIEPSNPLSLFGPAWWIINLKRKIRKKLRLKGQPPGFWLFPWQVKEIIMRCGLTLTATRSVGVFHPISKRFVKVAIALERTLNQKSIFRFTGSRLILMCSKAR